MLSREDVGVTGGGARYGGGCLGDDDDEELSRIGSEVDEDEMLRRLLVSCWKVGCDVI